MKIKTHSDETVREIVLQVQNGATLESLDGLLDPARPQRYFQIEMIHIRVEFSAGRAEISYVSVRGPLVKKDGTLSDMVHVRTFDLQGWTKHAEMPAWLAKLVVQAVGSQTQWWEVT